MISETVITGDFKAIQQKFEAFMKRYQEDKVVSEKWQQALNNELEELSKTMSSMWMEGWDNGDKDNNRQESNDRCLQGKEKGHLMCLDIPS